MVSIEAIIWYLVLVDSVMGNFAVWFSPKLRKVYRKIKFFSKHLPATRGWMAVYLALVLWVGYGLYRLGVLPY